MAEIYLDETNKPVLFLIYLGTYISQWCDEKKKHFMVGWLKMYLILNKFWF
jgi:hypothetical protein